MGKKFTVYARAIAGNLVEIMCGYYYYISGVSWDLWGGVRGEGGISMVRYGFNLFVDFYC